jgi:hypothetical protein
MLDQRQELRVRGRSASALPLRIATQRWTLHYTHVRGANALVSSAYTLVLYPIGSGSLEHVSSKRVEARCGAVVSSCSLLFPASKPKSGRNSTYTSCAVFPSHLLESNATEVVIYNRKKLGSDFIKSTGAWDICLVNSDKAPLEISSREHFITASIS